MVHSKWHRDLNNYSTGLASWPVDTVSQLTHRSHQSASPHTNTTTQQACLCMDPTRWADCKPHQLSCIHLHTWHATCPYICHKCAPIDDMQVSGASMDFSNPINYLGLAEGTQP